jgi:hypothetical protein
MADHIEISADGGATYKKIRVRVSDRTLDGLAAPPDEMFAGLNGANTLSVGAAKRRWQYRGLFQNANPPTGYTDYAFIAALFGAQTVAASKLKLKGMSVTTAADVLLANRASPNLLCLSFDRTADAAMWECDLDFVEQ